jgi:hypothetical protein
LADFKSLRGVAVSSLFAGPIPARKRAGMGRAAPLRQGELCRLSRTGPFY